MPRYLCLETPKPPEAPAMIYKKAIVRLRMKKTLVLMRVPNMDPTKLSLMLGLCSRVIPIAFLRSAFWAPEGLSPKINPKTCKT